MQYVHTGDTLTFILVRVDHPFYLTSLPPSCTFYIKANQMDVAELGNDEVEDARKQKQRYLFDAYCDDVVMPFPQPRKHTALQQRLPEDAS